jgi:uncharacterized protein YaaN involved in tellurite resistance
MYAYYLWVETLDSTVRRVYLQMERTCRLQQDDRLLREQQTGEGDRMAVRLATGAVSKQRRV